MNRTSATHRGRRRPDSAERRCAGRGFPHGVDGVGERHHRRAHRRKCEPHPPNHGIAAGQSQHTRRLVTLRHPCRRPRHGVRVDQLVQPRAGPHRTADSGSATTIGLGAPNPDDSLTEYIQQDRPADDAEAANCLPAPEGSFNLTMRYYPLLSPVLDKRCLLPPIRRPERQSRTMTQSPETPRCAEPGISARRISLRSSRRYRARSTDTLFKHVRRAYSVRSPISRSSGAGASARPLRGHRRRPVVRRSTRHDT
jgi:hypothetical protein